MNKRAGFEPFKMLIPTLNAGIEEKSHGSTFGIERLLPVSLAAVAYWARQPQVLFVWGATSDFGDDMVDLQEGTNDTLRSQILPTTKTRRFGHTLA
jgi:hypothetical protein